MSIADAIRHLENAGQLIPYRAARTRLPARRRAYLTQVAARAFNEPTSAVNLLCGIGPIAAALTRWVQGELVYQGFLKRLDPPPPGVWEIRVTEPVVQARLFGRFAEANTLIVMRLHTRQHLGRKHSPAWRAAMADCVAQWEALFPTDAPHSGTVIHDYVTENCDAGPIHQAAASDRQRPRRIRRRPPA